MPTLAEYNRNGGNQTRDPSLTALGGGIAGSITELLKFLATLEDRKDKRASDKAQLGIQTAQLELMQRGLEDNLRRGKSDADSAGSNARVQGALEGPNIDVGRGKAQREGFDGTRTEIEKAEAKKAKIQAAEMQATRQHIRLDGLEGLKMAELELYYGQMMMLRNPAPVDSPQRQTEMHPSIRTLKTAYEMKHETRAQKLLRGEAMVKAAQATTKHIDTLYSGLGKIFQKRFDLNVATGRDNIQTVEEQVQVLAVATDPVNGDHEIDQAIATGIIMNRINQGLPVKGPVDGLSSPTAYHIADVDGNYDQGFVSAMKKSVPTILENSKATFTEASQRESDLKRGFIRKGVDPDQAADFAAAMVPSDTGFGQNDTAMNKLINNVNDELALARIEGRDMDEVELGTVADFETIIQEARFRDKIIKSPLTDDQKQQMIDNNVMPPELSEAAGLGKLDALSPQFTETSNFGFHATNAPDPRSAFDKTNPIGKFLGTDMPSLTDDPAALGAKKLETLAKIAKSANEPVEDDGESAIGGVRTEELDFDPEEKSTLLDFTGGGDGDKEQRAAVEEAINNARLEGEVGALMQVLKNQQEGQGQNSAGAADQSAGAAQSAANPGMGAIPAQGDMTNDDVLAMIQQQMAQAPQGAQVGPGQQPLGALPPGAGNQGQPGALPGNLEALLQAIQGGRQQSGAFSPQVGGFGLQ